MTMRLRLSDERVNVIGRYHFDTYNRTPTCSSTAVWSTIADVEVTDYLGSYAHMSDVVTPNFKKLSKAGIVTMSPMSSSKVVLSNASGVAAAWRNLSDVCTTPTPFKNEGRVEFTDGITFGGQTSGFNFSLMTDGTLNLPAFLIGDSDVGDAIREASTAVWNARGRAGNNLYETTAEAHKSISLLNDILGNAVKVIGRKAALLERAKDASSAYLAYRYGLKPVMLDVEAVVKGLAKEIGTVRQTSRNIVTLNKNSFVTVSANYAGAFDYIKNFSHTEVTSVRAMSLDESYVDFYENIGFADKGLITLPWELLPYSFVADWFANIGDYIGSLVPTPKLRQLGTCFVVKRVMTSAYAVGSSSPVAGWSLTRNASGTHNRVVTHTYRVPGIPQPSMVIRSNFRLDNLTRAVDALALITQKLR